jgi:hypothetical protein
MGQFIGKTIIEGGQGRTIKKYDLNNIVGRPTGQGYGKARNGPQTAVTEKKPTGKRAARRRSFCARSAGQMKKFPKAAKNPNSRLRQARRRWRC